MKHFQDSDLIDLVDSAPIGGFQNDEISEQLKEYNEHSMMYRSEDSIIMEDYENGIKHFND